MVVIFANQGGRWVGGRGGGGRAVCTYDPSAKNKAGGREDRIGSEGGGGGQGER